MPVTVLSGNYYGAPGVVSVNGKYGYDGGTGLDLSPAAWITTGNLTGGIGGAGSKILGSGGVGVVLESHSTLTNHGAITGGYGASSAVAVRVGTPGGYGVVVKAEAELINDANIVGGTGGYYAGQEPTGRGQSAVPAFISLPPAPSLTTPPSRAATVAMPSTSKAPAASAVPAFW